MDELEWGEPTKQDLYMAQIAAEIRIIREGFSNSPKAVAIKDCLFDPFDRIKALETIPPDQEIEVEGAAQYTLDPETGEKRYEIGPELVKDPKWAKVNENAKAQWAVRFGVESLEELSHA